MRRPHAILLALVLAGSFAFHAYRAEHPTSSYQSADERSYGKLAIDLAEDHHYGSPSTGMRDPLHWPPGAPILFAAAHQAAPDPDSQETKDIPAAYWAQALVSLGTTLAAFALAFLLAGAWAGVAAAALVGFYPPLILATGEAISEPLGAFLLAAALAMLARVTRRGRAFAGGLVAAGVLLGLRVLTRADLLLVPFLLAALVFLWAWRRDHDPRGGLRHGGLVALGAVLVMAPWTIYVSQRAGKFVPVTTGSSAALFVGTYMPGFGNTVGFKRALADELYAKRPDLRHIGAFDLEAGTILREVVAAKHPDLPVNEAVSREAKRNIGKFFKEDPVRFSRMLLNKVPRMWTRYARGGARHTDWKIRVWHIILVLGAFAGIVAGLLRRREVLLAAVLLAALYSTALHMLVVSQARYNLPLMPALIAAGVAGWALWWRERELSRRDAPPRPPTVEERLHGA